VGRWDLQTARRSMCPAEGDGKSYPLARRRYCQNVCSGLTAFRLERIEHLLSRYIDDINCMLSAMWSVLQKNGLGRRWVCQPPQSRDVEHWPITINRSRYGMILTDTLRPTFHLRSSQTPPHPAGKIKLLIIYELPYMRGFAEIRPIFNHPDSLR
jgi:hypothetical protein